MRKRFARYVDSLDGFVRFFDDYIKVETDLSSASRPNGSGAEAAVDARREFSPSARCGVAVGCQAGRPTKRGTASELLETQYV